jgi:hypothetical protein
MSTKDWAKTACLLGCLIAFFIIYQLNHFTNLLNSLTDGMEQTAVRDSISTQQIAEQARQNQKPVVADTGVAPFALPDPADPYNQDNSDCDDSNTPDNPPVSYHIEYVGPYLHGRIVQDAN